jgi:hypothetical protein
MPNNHLQAQTSHLNAAASLCTYLRTNPQHLSAVHYTFIAVPVQQARIAAAVSLHH